MDPTTHGSADLSRPLVGQVADLGAAYWDWVHASISPVQAEQANAERLATGDPVASRWPRSLRMFEQPLLERLSHVPWWLVPLVWVPIV